MKKTGIVALIIAALTTIATGGCTATSSASEFDLGHLINAVSSGAQAITLTNAQVQDYVRQSVAYMDAQNSVAPASSKYTQRLKRITKGINKVGTTPLNFKVYITKEINAFACADGSVRVYSGIMDMMNDDELLGIIGHEVGHVAEEHSKNAFKQQLINNAVLEGLASMGGKTATLSQGLLAQLANSLVTAKYSRKQETDADNYGYNFLKTKGRNPYSLVNAFEKMQQYEQKSGSSMSSTLLQAFSDHPNTSARIANITKKCEQDGYRPIKK